MIGKIIKRIKEFWIGKSEPIEDSGQCNYSNIFVDVEPLRTGRLKTEEDYLKEAEACYGFKTPYSTTCRIDEKLLIVAQERMEGRTLPVHRIRLYLKNIKKIFNEWERDLSESK